MPVSVYNKNKTDLEKQSDITPDNLLEAIRKQLILKRIEKRMLDITNCHFDPKILFIENYNQLRHTPGQLWQTRIFTLFGDVYLPHSWIIDICNAKMPKSHEDPNEVPDTVCIKLRSLAVKIFVKNSLTHFLSYHNTNIKVYD